MPLETIHEETIQVQVRFAIEDKDGRFADALYYSPDEWQRMGPAEREADKEAKKAARHKAWKEQRKNPPPPPPLEP